MRHLIGFILAIALGAALSFAAGWGFTHMTSLAALGGTGLLLGILLAVRAISPLATGLPGLVLLAWSALLAVSAHRALGWVPLQGYSFGAGFRALLAGGTMTLLGAAMIIPLFLPSRWRGADRGDDIDEEEAPVTEASGLLS